MHENFNRLSHALNVATVISFLIDFHQNRMMAFSDFFTCNPIVKDTLTVKHMEGLS